MNMDEGALRVVRDCVGVSRGDSVLIVTDPLRPQSVVRALFQACQRQGARPIQMVFDGTLAKGQAPEAVGAAMECADVVFCVTTHTLGYSTAAHRCTERGGRVVAMTEAPESLLTGPALTADFPALRGAVQRVMQRFNAAEKVHITAPGGTDLSFQLTGRKSSCCLGTCLEPGVMAAVPDMEVYIAPVEGTAEGTLVADVSGTGLGLLEEPVTLHIRSGRAVEVAGGRQAGLLEERLRDVQGADVLAEFAVGLNPCAKPVGSIVIDEGVYGTGHFALGSNTGFGGKNSCGQHLDLVYWSPTVTLDGELFMQDGIIL